MDLSKYNQPISLKSKSNIGILVIHGFTSTTQSIAYIAEKFNNAGYNIESPILKGHAATWQELNKAKYEEWQNDVETALTNLKERASEIFVVGLSMGGTLALYLAENHPEILGVVLINHALFKRNTYFHIPYTGLNFTGFGKRVR